MAAFGLAGWVVLYVKNPTHKDFRIFYVAAEAGLRYGWPAIYDISTLRALSSSFPAGQTFIDSQATYTNPPLLAWIIAPFTLLPLPVAYAMWTVLALVLLLWAWHVTAPWRGLAKVALLLAALAMWPVIDSLYYGQPSILIVALVAATWWLASRERPIAAGAVLAVATALKPQVVFLVPFALLAAGRSRTFVAWAAGSALLAVLFLLALGQLGLARWWQTLAYVQSDPHHSYFTFAYALGAGPITYVVEGVLAVAALVVARLRGHQLEMVVATGMIGSLAASFHLHESDFAGLVLAGWLILRTPASRWQQGWLVASIVGMQAISLAQPLPQLVLDAGWLIAMAISSFVGSGASAPATRLAGASAGREDK